MLSFWGVGSLLGKELVVTTEDRACVFPFTGPRVWGETVEPLVSWTVSCDAGPGSSAVVTTEDGPRVWVGTVKLLVSCTESSDVEPGSSVLVVWTAVVVNVPLSARRVLVSGEGMNVG